MEIQNYSYYKPIVKVHYTRKNPSFGISFKPKELRDIFQKFRDPSDTIKSIRNVKPGEYGTICHGSKPLSEFFDAVIDEDYDQICARGISTNTGGWANCVLKSKSDNPLSTSCVFDCSVLYLFNRETNTHMLYHSYYDAPEKDLKLLIKTFMKEGFSGASIVPGDKCWSERHRFTLHSMLNVLKKINRSAKINIFHFSSQYPEIVGYKGDMFEIANNQYKYFRNHGQASFKISNLLISDLFDRIEYECVSPEKVKFVREKYEEDGYDEEIMKVINYLLEIRSKDFE